MPDALQQIYDGLPNILCQGLCWNTCSNIPVAPVELVRIRRAAGKHVKIDPMPPTHPTPDSPMRLNGFSRLRMRKGMCPFLRQKQCSIHADRPFICRIYGVVEGLLCPHGCRPERELTDLEAYALFEKIRTLSNPA